MREAEARAELCEIRLMQLHVAAPAAVVRVLNVADHAVALIVHQHDHHVRVFLHGRHQLADVDHQTAVADEAHRLRCRVRERRADRHLDALADAAAKRMHASTRLEDLQHAVAPRAVRDRHVTNPVVVAAHRVLQHIDEALVRPEPLARFGDGHFACRGEIAGECRIDLHAAFEACRKLIEHCGGIAVDEELVAIAAIVGKRIGIDAIQRLRQRELVLERLVAAQARADHEQRITRLVELLDVRLHVEGAERRGMIFWQHAASLHARHDAEAELHETLDLRARVTRAAAEPQQRTLCLREFGSELLDAPGVVRQRVDVRRGHVDGPFHFRRLDVDRNLDADGTARRRLRDAHGFAHGRERGVDGTHTVRCLRNRREHRQLIRRFVDVREVLVQIGRFDLPGDVHERRARSQRFDHRARCVARSRARARERDAEAARNTRETIRHVQRACFAARADIADLAARVDRVEDRHVVNRDHAECGFDAALLEKSGDQFADGGFVRHDVQRLRRHRYGFPSCTTTGM
jgi:hypothetical protein